MRCLLWIVPLLLFRFLDVPQWPLLLHCRATLSLTFFQRSILGFDYAFYWIILGLIAGFIASKIVDAQGKGFFLDIALGIVGALVGGFIASNIFGWEGITGFDFRSLLIAIGGSVIVLIIYHALMGRRAV